MNTFSKIDDVEYINTEDDVVLDLNATPLDLNWGNVQDFEEEEEEVINEVDYDQPGPSGLNGSSGLNDSSEKEVEEDVYEEDDDEEVIDLSANMEPTTINLFKLNIAYQEVITRYIAHIDQLLHHNAFKRLELEMDIDKQDTKNIKKRSGGRIGMIVPPYFGDSFNPGRPNNPDQARIRELLPASFEREVISTLNKWTAQQKQQLSDGIIQFALKAKIQPLVSKLEYLMEKYAADETPETQEKINSTKQDIDKITTEASSNPQKLMGDVNTQHDWEAISNISLEEKRTAMECKLYWKNNLHPSISKSIWAAEEDAKLLALVKKNKEKNWPLIANELNTGRTALQCIRRYQTKLNKGFRSKPWTPEEDVQFLALAKQYRVGRVIPFSFISNKLKNRTFNQLLHHWNNSLNPTIRKTRWTAEEDVQLLQGIAACGPKWSVIRDLNFVPGRSDVQLRERFCNTLNTNAMYVPWTEKEDELLLKLHAKYGNRWVVISDQIENRSDSQCLKRIKILENARKTGKPTPTCHKRPKYLVSDGIRKCRNKLLKAICKNFSLEKIKKGKFKPIGTDEMSKLKITLKSGQLRNSSRKRKNCEILSHKILQEIEKESDISETIKIYDTMLSFQEKRSAIKRPKLSKESQELENETIKLLSECMQPLMAEANIANTNINKLRTSVVKKSVDLTPKNVFSHYLKKLNVDAKEAINVIKAKNMPQNGSADRNEDGVSHQKRRRVTLRKLHLNLCAPNRATVRGFCILSNVRDKRKRSAKSIIQTEDSDKEHGKYTVDELLKPIQATDDYKMFRSRFVSLLTWPTVLASIIPSNRQYPNNLLRPIMNIKSAFLDQMYVKRPEDLHKNNQA